MSACSSQLSPSLLGAAAAEVDSASTAHLTTQRQPRSASVGKLHGSARITKSSRSSRGAASSVSQPKEHSSSRAASTPASPQSPALPVESVASQGHRPSSTPLSSASTGQSRASSGSNISNKPRWQQSTAASSRHQHTGTSHPGPKQSFLTRLQAQAGQAAPDKQQQHDAKAAEMKAKLQEWRQQQKQQKQQQQQQRLAQNKAPNDVPGRLVMPVKKTLLQQPRLSGAKGNPVPALADPG